MKKLFAWILALAIALTMCGAAVAEGAYAGETPVTNEPVTLTVMCSTGVSSAYATPSNDVPYWQYIEELTGVHIEWNCVATESYGDSVAALLAAGQDLPDIIVVPDTNTALTAGRNGLLVDMSTLKDNMYYIPQMIEQNDFARSMIVQEDGSMYYVYSTASPTRNQISYLYNKGWMDQLGLEIPTTLDEFMDVCRKMKGVDFNGNGRDDEVVMLVPGWPDIYGVGSSFGLETYQGTGFFVANEEGVVSETYTSENMRQFLSFVRDMYAEGILDPQFFTADWESLFEAVAADRVGIVYTFTSFAPDLGGMTPGGQTDPYAEYFTVGGPLVGPNGDQYMIRRDISAGDCTCITRDCKNPEAAMRWLDVVYAKPEVQETRYYGLEGMTYTIDENGEKQLLLPAEGTWTSVRDKDFGGGQIPLAHQQVDELWLIDYDKNPQLEWWYEQDVALAPYFKSYSIPNVPLNEEEQEIKDMYGSDFEDYVDEMTAKFIKGEAEPDEATWAEYSATLESLGLSELTRMYQMIYDRTR